jgi:hypothetical protein
MSDKTVWVVRDQDLGVVGVFDDLDTAFDAADALLMQCGERVLGLTDDGRQVFRVTDGLTGKQAVAVIEYPADEAPVIDEF